MCLSERMRACEVVLCLQDTTELSFNGQDIAGLGPLSYETQRGMYVHVTYAVTHSASRWGVLDARMWAREVKNANGVRTGIEESAHWIEGYERVAELVATMPGTRLTYVADQESDIMDLMVKAHENGCPVDWLLRSQHNRVLPEGGTLWDEALSGEPLGEIRFTLAARQGRPFDHGGLEGGRAGASRRRQGFPGVAAVAQAHYQHQYCTTMVTRRLSARLAGSVPATSGKLSARPMAARRCASTPRSTR